MAYGSASTGMIDCVRRLTKRRPDIADAIRAITKEAFDNDINAFMKDLRNNLAHGSVVVPTWRMDFDANGSRGSMNFNPVELMLLGTWSAGAKRYIESESNLHLGKIVREHFKCVNLFSLALTDLFAKNISPAEEDYYEIEDEHRRGSQRQWFKILVSQMGKTKDPYAYLHRFFTSSELRLILRHPKHSKEQVDLIISLKNSEIDCDDELRVMLYKMFGVT